MSQLKTFKDSVERVRSTKRRLADQYGLNLVEKNFTFDGFGDPVGQKTLKMKIQIFRL